LFSNQKFFGKEYSAGMNNLMTMLKEVAYNFYWSWNREAFEVFNDINPDYWKWSMHNPVLLLNKMDPSYLEYVIEKKHLGNKILNIFNEYRYYMERKTYFEEKFYKPSAPQIAYFSAEYGITECMRIYSGGLGVLSGDHLKSSSDLGVPLVGIGLAYMYGYFTQVINRDGIQTENYEPNDFDTLPMNLLRDDNYLPLKIELKFPGRTVLAQAWQLNVGRVKLFLLDTSLAENTVDDRRITDRLYGGNHEKRIMQEIVLGIGGVRLLDTLGYDIKAYHLNEGHSAFLCFERIRNQMRLKNLNYKNAKAACYNSNIFTTHTPVPAGIDIFERDLFYKYFSKFAENEVGISVDELFLEGNLNPGNGDSSFNMAYLAINNSNFVNGVSRLHGEVSRKMWHLPDSRTQITSITNGIHTPSYISPHTNTLLNGYFTDKWEYDETIWQRFDEIPDEEIWALRQLNKMELIKFVRRRLKDKRIFLGESSKKLKEIDSLLDPNALTIGFARRFATYKRGNLILRDPARLKKILGNQDRPVQIIFSGKAHPKDEQGKALIAEINSFTKDEELKNKIIFIDNYNIYVARYLVEGCDIWLNNPRRPQEASGTSGMKVIANGGLNFSILDGWWAEGYSAENGWKIDTITDENMPVEQRDAYEAESLYSVLENEIIPLYYTRNKQNIPKEWIRKIRASVRNLAGYFSTNRMVKEYTEKAYIKAIEN
jgi:starch phosphorylase